MLSATSTPPASHTKTTNLSNYLFLFRSQLDYGGFFFLLFFSFVKLSFAVCWFVCCRCAHGKSDNRVPVRASSRKGCQIESCDSAVSRMQRRQRRKRCYRWRQSICLSQSGRRVSLSRDCRSVLGRQRSLWAGTVVRVPSHRWVTEVSGDLCGRRWFISICFFSQKWTGDGLHATDRLLGHVAHQALMHTARVQHHNDVHQCRQGNPDGRVICREAEGSWVKRMPSLGIAHQQWLQNGEGHKATYTKELVPHGREFGELSDAQSRAW